MPKTEKLLYRLRDLTTMKIPVSVSVQHWERGLNAIPHQHDFTEIVLIRSGCGINRINWRAYPAMTGDIYIIHPGEEHTFHTASQLELLNVMFRTEKLFSRTERALLIRTPEYRALFGSESAVGPLRFSPEEFQKLLQIADELNTELHAPGPLPELTIRAQIMLFIGKLCKIHRTEPHSRTFLGRSATVSKHLAAVFDYVNGHFCQPVSASEIASYAGITPDYLSDFFRAQTGMPLVQYINSLRIARATFLLTRNPEKNITEIASECGFFDSGYFTRMYRRSTGMTPSEIRNNATVPVEKIRKKSQKKR